jgi:hypothetical protein
MILPSNIVSFGSFSYIDFLFLFMKELFYAKDPGAPLGNSSD